VEKKYLTSHFVRKYRGEDPGSGSELTETGKKVVDDIAKAIQIEVQRILQERGEL